MGWARGALPDAAGTSEELLQASVSSAAHQNTSAAGLAQSANGWESAGAGC